MTSTATIEQKPLCQLSDAELAVVREIREKFGVLTVRDADPAFRFSFGPWVRDNEAHRVGVRFFPRKGKTGAWDDKETPDQNRAFEREYLTIGEGSSLYPDGVKVGTFKVFSRHVGGVDKWDYVDRIYDITADEVKRLKRVMNEQRHVTQEEMRAIERKNEAMRVRAAEIARDPEAAARITADAIGTKIAEAIAKAATAAPDEKPKAPRVTP